MKIFVTGAGGQLGNELVRVAQTSGHIVTASRHGDLDITDPSEIRNAFVTTRPDVVVHAACDRGCAVASI